jgi:hypothetical protein
VGLVLLLPWMLSKSVTYTVGLIENMGRYAR